uniref:Uncharacterized protein n=1 Tax=Ascaris lumbricoides TaxID=6252 RepID=A0A0M3IA66_ASCLU
MLSCDYIGSRRSRTPVENRNFDWLLTVVKHLLVGFFGCSRIRLPRNPSVDNQPTFSKFDFNRPSVTSRRLQGVIERTNFH